MMKTEVWALVGIVAENYSDTTSDSLILLNIDFEIVSEPGFVGGRG